jgi:PAS domain S-box-containing protein
MDILDFLPDAVFIVANAGGGGRIRYANPQAARLFGYSSDELANQPVEMLIPARLAGQHERHRRLYAQAPRMRAMGADLPLLGRRRDGSEFPIAVQLNAIDEGPDPSTCAIVRDLTEHARLQDALTLARDAAVRANEVKSRFLAAASHDLRQPLQTIWSLQSLLARELKDSVLAPHVALLEEAVRSMDQILSSLIDINRLEQGAIQPVIRDFPLREILARLRSEFGYSAASKSLQLEIEDSPEFARSDPMLLLVILRNLLGNAVKYTPHGAVRLGVRVQDADLCIDVSDTGPGIPPEHLGRLFDAFYQIDNPGRDQRRGVGLGLSIVQTVCRLLGHTVSISSSPGQGSTFSVRVPRGLPVALEAAPPPQPTRATAPARGTCVLHIEDDPGVATSMGMLLRVEGYDVVVAASRDEAIEQVNGRGLRPDLILCDYQLPQGYTGDEILAELVPMLASRPPTILLTGDIADKHLATARNRADRVMSKPVDVDVLLREMASLLGRAK